MNFGKSKARVMEPQTQVTFGDVAGIDQAVELNEVVDFLKNADRFSGGKIWQCAAGGATGNW